MANPIPNLFRVPELKEKILFTLFILLIYRVGAHITVPGVDVGILRQQFGALQGGILGIYDMFVGGGLSRATIFALGIMPYISASIMFQLLAAMLPTVEKLQKEGEEGRKKLTQWGNDRQLIEISRHRELRQGFGAVKEIILNLLQNN